ncbi:MAG: YtxH domain-containing protein [Flavobacteriaceae bacterium]|nr:YtxH domain-containing protein [Flavobacteriaceae bacterium]
MSDEKSLGDDLNDMLGDAKEGARKAAKKAEEFGQEAKEKAKEFSEEAKEKFDEFSQDTKEVLGDAKNVALVAHLTLIGWVIAFVMNGGDKKTEYASFYLRQMLGLMLFAIVLSFIPIIGWFANLIILVLWIMSLVGALSGEKKETPVIGHLFQDWFKSI